MSHLKLDNRGKPGRPGLPFRPIVGYLSSAPPQSRLAGFEPRTHQSRARALNQ